VLDNIYNRVLEKVVLPLGDKVEGGGFMPLLRRYRKEQWFSAEQLSKLQRERLSTVLEFARTKVSYYDELPASLSDPYEDIKQFPVLSKAKINKNLDRLLTMPRETLIAESSSGSSGVQGTVYMDKSAQASVRAMQLLWFEWSGYKVGDSILQTGMTLQRGFMKGMKDYFLNTAYIPAFNLEPGRIESILREAEKNPRQYLFGYASSLYVLAQTAVELKISTVKFKYAISWGDKLFPHYRETIRRAFGCETLDLYGCSEGAMIAAQCPKGQFHLGMNQCYIEVVGDDGRQVPAGTMGKVLATRLDNFAMPLIRYYVGDLVEMEPLDHKQCDCGRQLPLLRRVIGRDTDIVVTRSGKRMIVHFFTAIFEHVAEIRQFKVVQKNLDEIEIHFIRGKNFGEAAIAKIENQIHSHLQENFPIHWVETHQIPATMSGKPQIVQSFLNHALN
jgi:phenylacetate-CoA ligase